MLRAFTYLSYLYMRIITFVLLCVMCLQVEAQSINKRYRSHIGNGGTTYFFVPKKLSKKNGVDKFIYDMTHLSTTDSVTLNFTIVVENSVKVESLILANGESEIKSSCLSLLYRDVLDDGYEIRTTSRFSLNQLLSAFSNDSPLIFKVMLSNGDAVSAAYTKSRWKKEKQTITKIFNSIIPLK